MQHLQTYPKPKSEQIYSQPTSKHLYSDSQPYSATDVHSSTRMEPLNKKQNLSATIQNQVGRPRAPQESVDCNNFTTSEAEEALRKLVKYIDSKIGNKEFLSDFENRRLLQILGLKAKKRQAVLDEKFLIAHDIKSEIDNLCNSK